MLRFNLRRILVPAIIIGVCSAAQLYLLLQSQKKLLQMSMEQNGAAPTRAHVVYSVDEEQFVGMKASVTSLITNTASPANLTIHIFRQSTDVATTMEESIFSELAKWVDHMGASIAIHEFGLKDVEPFINSHYHNGGRGNLKSPANYVRFLLPSKLPDVDSCLWLDSDTIVSGDIVPFLRARRGSDMAISAFPRADSGLPKTTWKVLSALGADLAPEHPSFNAGIIWMNLRVWREHDYQRQIAQLCNWNEEQKLWPGYGSQPPLQLLFGGDRFEHLSASLYQGDLGWRKVKVRKSTLFLHWNGEKKPWLPTGAYKEHWDMYNWHNIDQVLAKLSSSIAVDDAKKGPLR